jgi:hypothetical protein
MIFFRVPSRASGQLREIPEEAGRQKCPPHGRQREPTAWSGVPAMWTTLPTDGIELPVDRQALPTDRHELPVDRQALPTDRHELPVDRQALPTDRHELPVDRQALPTDRQALPTDWQKLARDRHGVPPAWIALPAGTHHGTTRDGASPESDRAPSPLHEGSGATGRRRRRLPHGSMFPTPNGDRRPSGGTQVCRATAECWARPSWLD